MGQRGGTSSEEDDLGPLAERIGEIRWRMALPRTGYQAYRLGLGLALAPFGREARNWLLKRFLVAAPLIIVMEVATVIHWRPYILLYVGGRGFGPYAGDGDTLLAILVLTWCIAVGLTVLSTKLKSSRILHNMYATAAREDPQRELIFGERGLLVASPDTRTVFRWDEASRLVAGRDHWYLVFRSPAVAIAIPTASVAALADGDELLAFLRERIGSSLEPAA